MKKLNNNVIYNVKPVISGFLDVRIKKKKKIIDI